jgi:hypothetical protein
VPPSALVGVLSFWPPQPISVTLLGGVGRSGEKPRYRTPRLRVQEQWYRKNYSSFVWSAASSAAGLLGLSAPEKTRQAVPTAPQSINKQQTTEKAAPAGDTGKVSSDADRSTDVKSKRSARHVGARYAGGHHGPLYNSYRGDWGYADAESTIIAGCPGSGANFSTVCQVTTRVPEKMELRPPKRAPRLIHLKQFGVSGTLRRQSLCTRKRRR